MRDHWPTTENTFIVPALSGQKLHALDAKDEQVKNKNVLIGPNSREIAMKTMIRFKKEIKVIKGFRGIAFCLYILLIMMGTLYAQNYDRETKITNTNGQRYDQFGSAVAADGDLAIIGAMGDYNNGSAFIYQFNGSGWDQKAKLTASDASYGYNFFGAAVALKGNIAVVGSPVTDEGGGPGQAYIYRFNGSRWVETQKLTHGIDGDGLAQSLDFDGRRIIVGASGENNSKGAAYIYHYQDSLWVEEQKLEISDGTGVEDFGRSVAIDGNTVMVTERTGEISGKVYIYEYNGTTWEQKQVIENTYGQFNALDIDGNRAVASSVDFDEVHDMGLIMVKQDTSWVKDYAIPRRGLVSAINGDKVIVGDYIYNTSYLYWLKDSVWTEYEIVGSTVGQESGFGKSVAIHNNQIFVGAHYENAAYVFDLIARPFDVQVSNGQYSNRTKIKWKSSSTRPQGYKILRDGKVIDSTATGARAYYDYGATPGKIQTYSVMAYNNSDWGYESPQTSQLGWQKTNGKLEGSVQTLFGAGVDSVRMNIDDSQGHLGSSLQFHGNDDNVILNPYDSFPDKALTVSFWIKTTDTGDSYPFSYACTEFTNGFLIGRPANLVVLLRNANTGSTNISVNDGQWHHVAVSWQSDPDGEITILKDGKIVFSGALGAGQSIPQSGAIVLGQDQDAVGGGFDPNQAFNGLLDEVRIWNKVRDPEDIQADMYRKLKGDEGGLVSYWSFDDLPDRTPPGISGDYKIDGAQHAHIYGPRYSNDISPVQSKIYTDANGVFGTDNIYYGQSTQFELSPLKWGHHFDPGDKTINMSLQAPIHKSVSFIDTTALTIIGTINFEGTSCAASDVEIFVDDKSSGVFTNSSGEFKISVDQPGTYDLRPSFGVDSSAHKFKPAHSRINVEESVLDAQFADSTRHLLYGKFGGACGSVIGTAKIILSSFGDNAGCFKDTISTDDSGNFSALLPAQPYMIEILSVSITDPEIFGPDVLQYFGTDTLDLTWSDRQNDFIFRHPPVIKVSDWPKKGGGAYNVPIMDQQDSYDITIEVSDVQGQNSCPVSQGSVTIYDYISDKGSEPVTLDLVRGMTTYTIRPGLPNLLDGGDHPYQKKFELDAHIGEETVKYQQWAVVTGGKQRGSEFYTVPTPEIAFWVLHDPPGDQSFSFFQKDSTYSQTMTSSWNVRGGAGIFANLQIGAVASFGWAAGFGAETTWSTDIGLYAIADVSASVGINTESTHTNVVSFTTTEEFRTSDSDKFTGQDGDVYIGASFNDQFAMADILKFDWNLNKPNRDTALVYLRTNFGTDFMYTESYIMNTLVPKFKELARIASANGDEGKAKTYRSHAATWERQVFNQHQLTGDDNPNTKIDKNYSFSSGTVRTFTKTTHPQDTSWRDLSQFTFDVETRQGAGAIIMGCTYELGIKRFINTVFGTETETQIKTSETYGYTLADDDPGDRFTVDVRYRYKTLKDGTEDMYGPPIFNIVSGVSSNPWEKGTQARDGVHMAIDKNSQYNVQPDAQAPFILYLGNTSESGEEREYYLSVIQSSNLDGAIIRVGGVVIEDHLSYTIPAGQQLNATMTVERGPIAYDYENLKIKFYAPGDEENIADTLTFSVHYISPCSNVNLLLPENNWVLNSSAHDTMQIVMNEFDRNNEHLKNIKFQYRRRGEGWSTAFLYPKETISGKYIIEYWNVDQLPDGEYELRAVSDCGTQGVKYSAIAEGVIDRSALIVFGTPEPADGVLNLGEDISFSFSGEIDPAFLTANSAALMTASDSVKIEVGTSAFENKLIITPKENLSPYEDRLLIVTVTGIRDKNGNVLLQPVSRLIRVNLSPVYWTVPNIDYTVYQDVSDSFKRTLKNAGGQDESFQILSTPPWLVPTVQSGTIPAGGESEITFNVDTQLNVGSYLDTVVVNTSFGQERLIVSLEVLNKPPDWKITPSAFAYSANLTAQLVFDGLVSDDIYDIVSVYVGNELRGIANVEHIPTVDKYLAFLTIYSNQPSGDILTFRLWDASQGKEYAWMGSGLTFESNNANGTINTPLIIEPDANVQVIELNQGWTWFSLNVSPASMTMNSVLSSLSPTDGDIIKAQDGFSQYSSGYGWYGTLNSLETGKSYRIKMAGKDTLQVLGTPIGYKLASLILEPGWNWIAQLNQKILDVNETFAGMPASAGDKIKSQTAFADYLPSTQSWEGSLKKLLPGQGYILKSGEGANLQYPVLGKTAAPFPEIPEWNFNMNSYEYSMSITATLEFDGREMTDSTLILAAFSGYKCRGLTRVKYLPELDKFIGFLVVHSNSVNGDSISFKVYQPNQDKKRDVQNKLTFKSDEPLGNLESPFVLTAQPIGDELVPYTFYLKQNYPNPFNPETSIEYGLPNEAKVNLSIYNSLGQKVATLVDKKQPAHRYKVIFNAGEYNLASGIYFYQVKAGNYVQRRKMVFIK